MEDLGDFLFYLIFAFIAFVSWIHRKFQEASAERQRKKAEAEYRRRGGVVEDQSRYEQTPEEISTEETIRKLYESLGGPVAPPKPPTPPEIPQQRRTSQPPPMDPPPVKLQKVKRQALSKAEEAALARVQNQGIGGRRARRAAYTTGTLNPVAMIRDPKAQRAAIVLKEILDKPVSMRP